MKNAALLWKPVGETDSKWTQHGQYGSSSKGKHQDLPYDPATASGSVPTRIKSRDSSRYLHTPVHSSITHSSQKGDAPQGPADG